VALYEQWIECGVNWASCTSHDDSFSRTLYTRIVYCMYIFYLREINQVKGSHWLAQTPPSFHQLYWSSCAALVWHHQRLPFFIGPPT